jgi:phage baseplate assembly protein W
MLKGINFKLPFAESIEGGVFDVNKLTSQALTDDLLSLLTTRKGNRVMRSNIYSPIYDYINEPIDDVTVDNLQRDISIKINEFLPQIEVFEIRITPFEDENTLQIKILFTVKNYFNVKQSLVLNFALENNLITGNLINI